MADIDTATFPRRRHDHDRCIQDALAAAEALCAERHVRLTALRRRVLELVWRSHRPVKAYDILAALRDGRAGAAPPTVYRALDFLLHEGLIHRIESLNAYVGCAEPEGQHAGQFLICSECGTVGELNDPGIDALLEARVGQLGFRLRRQTIELDGVCPQCADAGDAG
ncbi:transcriptional repressor [Ectothiorhodospiraceae bacterium WFHF3C12]|nr:transcriptional repressor [Ectothiorhodospiraceae bacterium WFHF3C12]